jgi:hypothetical protein
LIDDEFTYGENVAIRSMVRKRRECCSDFMSGARQKLLSFAANCHEFCILNDGWIQRFAIGFQTTAEVKVKASAQSAIGRHKNYKNIFERLFGKEGV